MQKQDQERHAAARKAVESRRDELGKMLTNELLNGVARFAEPAHAIQPYYRRHETPDHISIRVEIPVGSLRRILSAEGRVALRELLALKDPTC